MTCCPRELQLPGLASRCAGPGTAMKLPCGGGLCVSAALRDPQVRLGGTPGVAFHFFLGACLSGGRVGFFRPASVFRKRPITFHLRVVLLRPVGGDRQSVNASLQLSATDVSAQTTMKGAAKCDKHCDLQNSVNQQGLERILRFRDTPESMPASVSTFVSCRCSASP